MVIGIDTAEQGDRAAIARQFRDRHRLTYPILIDLDDSVARRYGVEAFPTNLIIDRDGVVRYHQAGFDSAGMARQLEQLLAP